MANNCARDATKIVRVNSERIVCIFSRTDAISFVVERRSEEKSSFREANSPLKEANSVFAKLFRIHNLATNNDVGFSFLIS